MKGAFFSFESPFPRRLLITFSGRYLLSLHCFSLVLVLIVRSTCFCRHRLISTTLVLVRTKSRAAEIMSRRGSVSPNAKRHKENEYAETSDQHNRDGGPDRRGSDSAGNDTHHPITTAKSLRRHRKLDEHPLRGME